MNVRKPIDYSGLFASLNTLMAAELPQMELYCKIGQIVCDRAEKGAAVAAAEYLQRTCPDTAGFSPRNLRRMREFYRACANAPDMMAAAMLIGWTQNVIIMESELTVQDKLWYIQAVHQFGWSKMELLRQIDSAAHLHLSLDLPDEVCYTEKNVSTEDVPGHAKTEDHECSAVGSTGPTDEVPSVLCLLHPRFLCRTICVQSILVRGWRGESVGVADGSDPPGRGSLWKTFRQESRAGQPEVVSRPGELPVKRLRLRHPLRGRAGQLPGKVRNGYSPPRRHRRLSVIHISPLLDFSDFDSAKAHIENTPCSLHVEYERYPDIVRIIANSEEISLENLVALIQDVCDGKNIPLRIDQSVFAESQQ